MKQTYTWADSQSVNHSDRQTVSHTDKHVQSVQQTERQIVRQTRTTRNIDKLNVPFFRSATGLSHIGLLSFGMTFQKV